MLGRALGYLDDPLRSRQGLRRSARRSCEAFGAELVLTDPLEGTDGAIRKARAMAAAEPEKYFYPDQYSNDANWGAHFETTGPEIWRDTRRPA